jgi:digeranylgeranylglycerophospholipid reductase
LTNARHDVVVVGGGPAGSMAAQTLAEAGRDVLLLEEHTAIGSPVHCTGLLGYEAFEEFGLPQELVVGEADSARFWGAAGQSVMVQSDRIRAAIVDRVRLDATIAARAATAGVAVRQGMRVERIETGPEGVSVTGPGFEAGIRARTCVLACGANYRFHKGLGLGAPTTFLQSAQLEAPFPEVPGVEIQLGQEVAPAGFAWLVPLRRDSVSCARIGLMAATQSRVRFRAFLSSLCQRTGARLEAFPEPRFKMLPLGPVSRTYARRVLAVGDAAGLVKPTTGGGIYYGLVSGRLAGEVLHTALATDRLEERDLRVYETRWHRRLGREIRVGLAFRRVAAGLTDESIDSLIELARVNGIVPLLQRTASFNWHSGAAMALLADASFRKLVFRSWRNTATA